MKKANNSSIQRISFRLKDLFTVIQDKQLSIRIFYNGKEIEYGNVALYKDMYVCNIGIGTDIYNNSCLMITVNDSINLIYLPNI